MWDPEIGRLGILEEQRKASKSKQWPASDGAGAKSSLLPVHVNTVLLEHSHARSFIDSGFHALLRSSVGSCHRGRRPEKAARVTLRPFPESLAGKLAESRRSGVERVPPAANCRSLQTGVTPTDDAKPLEGQGGRAICFTFSTPGAVWRGTGGPRGRGDAN